MKINAFLISPSLEHQDLFREALDLIEKSGINLSVQEVTNYSYKTSSTKFEKLFPVQLFDKRNKAKSKITKNPNSKYYDIVVVIGAIENSTMSHLIKCWQYQMFKKILVIDPTLSRDQYYKFCPSRVDFPDGDYLLNKLGTYAKNISDMKGIAMDFLSLYTGGTQIRKFRNKIAA